MNSIKAIVFCAGTLLFGAAEGQGIIAQEFHPNGKVKSTRFSDGACERFMAYYETGRVKEIGAFREGRRDGVWQQFDENGAVLARAQFLNGQRQGTWEFRDPANRLKVRLQYVKGVLARGEQYGDSGELIAQRTY
jgi:antitoxin component YwqK of YwqJK toxin-antitoxin module